MHGEVPALDGRDRRAALVLLRPIQLPGAGMKFAAPYVIVAAIVLILVLFGMRAEYRACMQVFHNSQHCLYRLFRR